MQGLLSQASLLRKVTLRGGDCDALRARQRLEQALQGVDWAPSGMPPQAVLLVRRMVLAPRGASAPAHTNAFAQKVTQALQACAASARRPWLQEDAATAEAVLFLDEAELAACLVSDALGGRVTAHWWWRAVLAGLTAQEWLRREVLASGRLIAPAISLLASRSQAVPWAERWTEAEAQMGLAALGQAHGWVPRVDLDFDVSTSSSTERETHGATGEMTTRPAQADVTRVLAIAPELRHATTLNSPAAHLLAASLLLSRDPAWLRTERGTAACAAWVALRQRESPNALRTPNLVPESHSGAAATAPRQDMHAMTRERPQADDIRRPPPEGDEQSGEATFPHEGVAAPLKGASSASVSQSADPHGSVDKPCVPNATSQKRLPIAELPKLELGVQHSNLAPEEVKKKSALETSPTDLRPLAEAIFPIAPAEAANEHLDLQQASRSTSAQPIRPEIEQASFGRALQSEYGGIFYLLNIALALELYGDFTQPRTPGLALSPWDLLAWTGRTWFGSEFERDPVWPLLAELAGRSPNRMPGRNFVPPTPTGIAGDWVIKPAWLEPWGPKPALRWRRTTRREHAWHPAGFVVHDVAIGTERPLRSRRAIWLRRLLCYVQARAALALGAEDAAQVPHLLCRHSAELQVSATALDVTLSLDALPLSVRLAGLDRNPGWIPAAGRSIYFHFR